VTLQMLKKNPATFDNKLGHAFIVMCPRLDGSDSKSLNTVNASTAATTTTAKEKL